jgi:hypothetical protein
MNRSAKDGASRIPCRICGLEILHATAERNQGLCGSCAKGARPCVYCGRHVTESLANGVYAHVECEIRHHQTQESWCWRTVNDIDWQKVRQILRAMLRRLFDKVHNATAAPVNLCFYVHVEDFIDISVHQVQPDGSAKPLTDSDWNRDLSPMDSSFSLLIDKLSEVDADQACATVASSLTAILRDECKELENNNFNFPRNAPVSWTIHSA